MFQSRVCEKDVRLEMSYIVIVNEHGYVGFWEGANQEGIASAGKGVHVFVFFT